MDKINGKTPEEIKRGLECCYDEDRALCEKCPYHYVRKDGLMRFTECSSMHSLGVDTMTYIQQLETQVPQWVSVKERLPSGSDGLDFCELIIARTIYGDLTVGWNNGGTWHLIDSDDDFISKKPAEYATHWMPLPKAPKEENT